MIWKPLVGDQGLKTNSVGEMRGDFIQNLPEKVKCGLDPETLSTLDLSNNTTLIQGEREYYERQFATLKSLKKSTRYTLLMSLTKI